MLKAIVIDLDDTLLRRDKTISQFTRQTLINCRLKGVKTIFATGRGTSAGALVPYGLFDGRIFMNGALAFADDAVIYKKTIPSQIFVPFLKQMSALGIDAAAEIGGVHFANFDVSRRWEREFVITDFDDMAENSEKLYAVIETPEQKRQILERLPAGLNIHFTRDNLALMTHGEATKCRALAAVLSCWDIPFSGVAAFGDDVNDKELLERCGVGIAMENALDEVKQAAGEVCGDCDHDGVAKWLAPHLL